MDKNQPVLAIYDLRGIQSFIFRTNKVKEIIGGSRIVSTLLEDAFEAFVKQREETEKHNLQWYRLDKDSNEKKPLDFKFDNLTESPASEILYCGGGNLLVAWRTAELALEAGKFMSRYILNKAYSLSLSWAMVYKTENYNSDYIALCEKLDRVKSMGYRATPLLGVPFSVQETGTGLPTVLRGEKDERISKETDLKRNKKQNDKDQWEGSYEFCQKVNEMTEGMRKNYVAVVHIDGNSMGKSIRDRLESCGNDYQKAVSEMRKLSLHISTTFENALNTAIRNQGEGKDKSKLMLRPIICAGDDITFIARADIALTMVENFINEIKEKGFSACAGITYVRAHFPFYQAYGFAEQLCASAKKKARQIEGEKMGNYVDFHIIGSGVIGDISSIRDREYVNAQGYSLLQRPLTFDDEKRTDSVSAFEKNIADWKGEMVDGKKKEAVSRKWLKALRNAYHLSKADVLSVGKQMSVYESRAVIKKETAFDENNKAIYFDALEMMDMVLGAKE